MRERPEFYQFSQLFGKESTPLKKYNAEKFSPLSQEKEVLDLERENAEKKSFTISPIVSEHRGIKEQSHLYQERRLNQEVRRRVDEIEDEAFKSGYEKGVEKGRREVLEKNLDTIEKNASLLSDLINEVLNKKSDILSSEIESVYTLIRNLTKWIILRELKSDDHYVYRLLEKIIG